VYGQGPGHSAPTGATTGRSLLTRVVLPSLLVWLAVTGVGLLVTDVFGLDEGGANRAFVEVRTDRWDAITSFVSSMGNTQVLMATCAGIVLFLWWRSRQWWFAVVPALSLSIQVSIFLTASMLVARERPAVEQLDQAAPTSSFPSGHTGATTSVYLALALCASRIQAAWLRVTVQLLCVAVAGGVALSRVYRGMHHPTDVLAGLMLGAACAFIAWNWLLRRTPASDSGVPEAISR